MPKTFRLLRHAAALLLLTATLVANAAAQDARDRDNELPYSDSDAPASRSRTAATHGENLSDILRAARRLYIAPNRHIDADYLEYKLAKLPEFTHWRLAIVKDKDKADLHLNLRKTALNYIFQIVEPESSIVVTTGKVVAINGLVAAEDISHEIIKKMRQVRALPSSAPE